MVIGNLKQLVDLCLAFEVQLAFFGLHIWRGACLYFLMECCGYRIDDMFAGKILRLNTW